MSEKRFICGLEFPINSNNPIRIISDSIEDKDYYKFSDICNVLNNQQATIEAKDKEIAELDQQCADFLGDKIKALEEFEECTDKLKQKIFDYKFEIKRLKMENDALQYALKYVKHIEVDIDVNGVIDDEI